VGTPLGDFLRARRDDTRPEAVGLPPGTRRRVPGLRRSELAALAGISVEYLIRIEQGTDRNPSVAVVRALGEALRLDLAEREHLRYLVKITGGVCAGPLAQPRPDVRRTVLALLDQLEPAAAMVTNRLGDVLAHTSGFDVLARPSGLLDTARPNLTRFVFTDRRARDVFPDWDQVADECAFDLWLGPSAGRSAAFTAELAPVAGEEFARRRNSHAVPPRGPLRWRHAVAGELRFVREALELPPADAQQLVVFLPGDDVTAEAMASLRRRLGAGLRAVR
jgi:transcriptional regulator with XRE-family HTH domain